MKKIRDRLAGVHGKAQERYIRSTFNNKDAFTTNTIRWELHSRIERENTKPIVSFVKNACTR